MALGGIVSYWMLPVISGVAWLATLLGLLLWWLIDENRRVYDSMEEGQTIAYISDIGATELQPLFIAGSVITSVFLDLAFVSERWLRHNGRLVANGSRRERVSSIFSIFFALVGTAGLILLSIFDTRSHRGLHNICLGLFILGYLVSAIFICWEYRRLGIHYREHAILRLSFWLKLFFIIVEFALAVGFAACMGLGRSNAAAILEWIVATVFTLYAVSFVIDLWPAVRTKGQGARFAKPGSYDMEEANTYGAAYPTTPNPPAAVHQANF
ncbi:Frag1/DRAM/Sfk1 [Stachybotrys elegans]|uniref:Frag1/DRAM/Sfk1 n=1 Tax=Stachybotrys elegans TaxID=80388 RepID=A0A8K0SSA5_9HYPO|nr:Frag1/DRAM/Sfk1 [Stachybotrys elegans]